jgi:hypothetical protein
VGESQYPRDTKPTGPSDNEREVTEPVRQVTQDPGHPELSSQNASPYQLPGQTENDRVPVADMNIPPASIPAPLVDVSAPPALPAPASAPVGLSGAPTLAPPTFQVTINTTQSYHDNRRMARELRALADAYDALAERQLGYSI